MDDNKKRTVFDCAKDDCEDIGQITKTLEMLSGHDLINAPIEIRYRKRNYSVTLTESI